MRVRTAVQNISQSRRGAEVTRRLATWATGGLIALCACAAGRAQTYSNPLSTPAFPPPGEFSDGPADPVIVYYEGRYYVFPTGDSVTYKAMWSEDLVHWQGDYTAFSLPPGSPWKTGALWAPEVERINGRYFMYYTAGAGGIEGQRIGVAEALTPVGPYVDRSYSAPLIDVPCIDAECFQDGDDLYMYYAEHEADPFKLKIWVRKLADPTTLDPNSTPQLCIEPGGSWEGTGVTEGPTVIKRDGKYYMFYSGFGALSPDYAVGAAVADHPLGPWIKQTEPLNPIYHRNDAIELYGPGHGDVVTGPDGISDWYIRHQKINTDENFQRVLAIDRLISTATDGARTLWFTSSGGTNDPTPAPRLPFQSANFEDGQLPDYMVSLNGAWEVQFGKLKSSPNATLLLRRALPDTNCDGFLMEWWLQADTGFSEEACSAVEFSVQTGSAGRTGWRITPAADVLEMISVDDSGATTVLDSTPLPADTNWRSHSRFLRMTKWGDVWTFTMDGRELLTVEHVADCGWAAWVGTQRMPLRLDGYRQTTSFVDAFESPSSTSNHWTFVSGNWSLNAPGGADDGFLIQSDALHQGWTIALASPMELTEFDLSADFRLISQVTGPGRFPKHGLIHNYVDEDNFATVWIDDQYDVVATNARIDGVTQTWMNAPLDMPDTFALGGFRHLAVTTDSDTGEFVYSLNGVEMFRRAYPGLPPSGRAGLICELSHIQVDNFRFSGTTDTTDVDGDGVPAAEDNCPNTSNPLRIDSDGDGVGDACDQCGGTPAGVAVDPLGCEHPATGDCDYDGDVDADDLACFVDCLAGPDLPPAPGGLPLSGSDCLRFFDFDRDGDVDLADVHAFRYQAFTCD